ncbi:polyprenyl synthetase family protein, partial [Streptomyces sp. SID9727]|nr:polyprenyl synthetase family protein [Streptomyces sp. SID9727]
EAGGRAAATAEAHGHLERARACLESVSSAPDALEEMLTLFPYVVDRTR